MVGERWVRVRCPACNRLTDHRAVQLLRAYGMLRREPKADAALVDALLESLPSRLVCSHCGCQGQKLEPVVDDDATDWNEARRCRACGRSIGRERLEVLPTAELCAACQAQADKGGETADAQVYCPRCGQIMSVVRRDADITRYALRCNDCGYRA